MLEKPTTVGEWKAWLAAWNRALLERIDSVPSSRRIEDGVTPEVLTSGWLGYPPATEDQINRLEARLGKTLPLSYRHFLEASNGLRQPGMLVWRLLPAEEVDWFRFRNQKTVDIWKANEDLSDALEISVRERHGTAVYLLDPDVVRADGEWQASYFAHWVPGRVRHSSLWELMQAEYQQLLLYLRPSSVRLETDEELRMLIVKFPAFVELLDNKIRSLAEDPYLASYPWSQEFAGILQTARSRVLEVCEPIDSPEALLRCLYELGMEFRQKSHQRVRDTGIARRAWSSAMSSVWGFLNGRHASLIQTRPKV